MPRPSHRFSVAHLVLGAAVFGLLSLPATGFSLPLPQQQGQQAPTLQLSLDQALRLALEQNLDIRVVDYDRDLARENIVTQRGAFDAVLQVGIPGATAVVGSVGGGFGQAAPAVGGIGFSSSKTPSTSSLAGADVSESDGYNTQVQVGQRFDFGLSYQFGYNVGRTVSNSLFTNLNPAWNNTLGFSIVQPLLKGRGKESSGAQLLLARANASVSEEAFRAQVNTILFNVVQAYWELVFSERNLAVAEQSLQLAGEQLGRTRAQVEVGMIAPVEETQAEVAVAQRRNELIVARNGLENATDNLRALLKAESLPGGWDTVIDATETPEIAIEQAALDEAIRTALANRPEIATARAQIAASAATRSSPKAFRRPSSVRSRAATATRWGNSSISTSAPGGWASTSACRSATTPPRALTPRRPSTKTRQRPSWSAPSNRRFSRCVRRSARCPTLASW